MKKIILFLALLFSIGLSFAHQPRIVDTDVINVMEPEISKAYYDKLDGKEAKYIIKSESDFILYVNLLLPSIRDQKTDLSAIIIKDGDTNNPLAKLDGTSFEWKNFFEPFGYDYYLMGPEFRQEVSAGTYEIIVSNPDNNIRYSLAVGEKEKFNFKETRNALKLIPKIKSEFFYESPMNFIFSPFGRGLILITLIISLLLVLIFTRIGKRFLKMGKNLNRRDRLIRIIIGIVLVLYTISSSRNPFLLLLAGLLIFTGIFGYCMLYAIFGKKK